MIEIAIYFYFVIEIFCAEKKPNENFHIADDKIWKITEWNAG